MSNDFSKGLDPDVPPKPPIGGEYKDAPNVAIVTAFVRVSIRHIPENSPEWNTRIDIGNHTSLSINGLPIPTGHYWRSGKIHPVMKKAGKKKRKH